jgi:hypothetical protein
MRKRIASINEALILSSERRIAVSPGQPVLPNDWLSQQGVGLTPLPLLGGSASCY